MRALFAAFGTLTILPLPARFRVADGDLAASVLYFPVVGLLLGALLAGVYLALKPFMPPLPLAAILLCFSVLLTRGLHLDGVADLADGLGAGGPPERILAVMKDSHSGAFGVIALILVLLLKFTLIAELIGRGRWPALILSAVLSRWAMALAAYSGRYARPGGTGRAFIGQVTGGRILGATFLTLLFSGLILQGLGLVGMALAALTTACFVAYLKKKIGGLTGDGLGALNEKVEVLTLGLVLLAERGIVP